MNIIANLIKLGNANKKSYQIAESLKKEGLTICSFYEKPTIQLYNGIEQVAEMVGAELTVNKHSDYEDKSFILDGVKYLQVNSSINGEFTKLEEVKVDENNK